MILDSNMTVFKILRIPLAVLALFPLHINKSSSGIRLLRLRERGEKMKKNLDELFFFLFFNATLFYVF